MAYTINGNIPCGTEACTGKEHTPAGACNSVYDIILDAIKEVKGEVANVDSLAKEATLLAKVAELKEALNTIDFTAIEQAIQNVENITAREATLIQGVGDIIKAVENIDFTDLENSIAEVKNAVANIDFSALAKEETLTQGISSVESKVEEESQSIKDKIDNIKLPEIDTTELAKEATLNAVSSKLDNLNVEVDLSGVAKQGENKDATNSKILEEVQKIPNLKNIYSARFEKNDDNINTYTMILPIVAGVDGDTIIL
jgi:hypothetical protein